MSTARFRVLVDRVIFRPATTPELREIMHRASRAVSANAAALAAMADPYFILDLYEVGSGLASLEETVLIPAALVADLSLSTEWIAPRPSPAEPRP